MKERETPDHNNGIDIEDIIFTSKANEKNFTYVKEDKQKILEEIIESEIKKENAK